jgi:hypothetical protein
MADGGLVEGALLNSVLTGAAVGGGASLLTGRDPLKGALMGGVTAGAFNGLMPGAEEATNAAPAPVAPPPVAPPSIGVGQFSGIPDASLYNAVMNPVAGEGLNASGAFPTEVSYTPAPGGQPYTLGPSATTSAGGSGIGDWWNSLSTGKQMLYGGGAGLGALMLAERKKYGVPGREKYTGALSRFRYDPSTYVPYTMAEGGIASLRSGGDPSLGSYSDGGHLLKGPGDGMSDNIPAKIGDKQPARLADGEFVVPADVVSHLGNGSTDAGAKQLYRMMSKVRKARTGNPQQGKQINPRKYVPV